MVNTQALKLNIIELVMNIEDDHLLAAIEQEARSILNRTEKPNVLDAIKPIRKHVSLEQIVQEQNKKMLDAATFFSLAEKVKLDEPIDDLLADLTA